MIMIANLQYSWTLFVQPLQDAHGWKKSQIQAAFTLFVLLQTWLVPLNGWLVDRFGPRPFVALAGVLVGASWLIFAHAQTLQMLYLGSILAGIGAGCVYGTMVGSAVKWFPDNRGLAVGLTAAGFGAGAALTVLPINTMIHTTGYASAFTFFGWLQGIAILVIAFFLRFPGVGEVPVTSVPLRQTSREKTPRQMLSSPIFYVLYAMFVMIATGLVFITAQVAPMAGDYGVAKVPLNVFGFIVLALPFALVVDNVLNGGSRALFGWPSDRIGRETTMSIAFSIEALALIGLIFAAHHPWLFVACAGATFVASGEIYSLFPATCPDLFGARYASTNAGLLYTAKGTAALIVPLASSIHDSTGSWSAILGVLVAFNVITAVLAFVVLKPMRERTLARERREDAAIEMSMVSAAS
ncbi:MAG: oxalate/formate MFS antiporter [Candidatus Eremiobacteraeota bacterium]|nr:oxalate/formate MFS antiporter [Candidatus Eremiobacteraeota bacterium]